MCCGGPRSCGPPTQWVPAPRDSLRASSRRAWETAKPRRSPRAFRLECCGALPTEAWLTYRHQPLVGDLWAGAYIDDLAHIGFRPRGAVAPTAEALAAEPAGRAHAAAVQGLDDLGVPRSANKAVLGSSEATVWGAHLSSRRRTVSADPSKRWARLTRLAPELSCSSCAGVPFRSSWRCARR